MPYGIQEARVPNLMQDISGGLKTAQGLDYWEDRKRLRERQAKSDAAGAEQKDYTRNRQAMSDFSMIAKNVNRDDPNEIKQALAWAAERSPEMKNVVWESMQQGPEAMGNLIDMFQPKTKASAGGSERATLYGPEGKTKRVTLEKGKDFIPEEGWSLSKPTKGMKIYGQDGNLIVDTSGGEMSKKTMGALEGGTMGDYETLHQLEEIKSVYDDKFLTYSGKATGWFNKIKEKSGFELSENDKEFIGTKKKFDQRVNQFFNSYRKLITGAAASVQELASLKEAVLNVDQSPTEFKAAYDDMVQGYQRSIRINHRLLRAGVKQGTKDWGERFDSLYMAGGDDVVNERAEEIKQGDPNITDEEIAGMLMSEGYQ